jgi:hypothetical protein
MADKGFTLILPPVLGKKFYTYGDIPSNASPGDVFIIRHGKSATKEGLLAAAISSGEHVLATISQPELKNYCWPTHVAICSAVENGIPILSELGYNGFQVRSLKDYPAECFVHIRLDLTDNQRAGVLSNNRAMSNAEYGWLEYFDIALDAVTHGHLTGTWGSTIICSTHVSLALMGSGVFFPDREPTSVIPAHFALWFDMPTPQNLKAMESGAMMTAALVSAHAVSRSLHETVYTPSHPKRGSSSAEFRASKEALEKETPGCWVCGRSAEQVGAPLEGHHLHAEWSLINSVDLAKIQESWPQAKSLQEWLDSVDNLVLLCVEHHRSPLYGVHMVTMPAWVVQKYQIDGWDLVNGPTKSPATARFGEDIGYYPAH